MGDHCIRISLECDSILVKDPTTSSCKVRQRFFYNLLQVYYKQSADKFITTKVPTSLLQSTTGVLEGGGLLAGVTTSYYNVRQHFCF